MSAPEPTSKQQAPKPTQQQLTSSSKVPVLGEGFQESAGRTDSKSTQSSDESDGVGESGVKTGKQRLFGFGRKKDTKKDIKKDTKKDKANITEALGSSSKPEALVMQPSVQRTPTHGSPSRPNHPYRDPSSPTHRALFSSSPRLVSPAGSQIFERDVQESAIPVPPSPAIPSHIQTENHIPPVLDASSEAITNKSLDPDSVEIVMHASHQPALVTMSTMSSSEALSGDGIDDLPAHPEKDDGASGYGALDNTDVRRLSFISFADVVQSEHAEHVGGRDSMHLAGLNSLSTSGLNRSPSPVRSPVSSQGLGTSPPTSKEASVKGLELSPTRKPLGLGNPLPSPSSGELTIETMSEALKKTGSGDFSGIRSLPLSPVSADETLDGPFK
ncbi:hypothetical protein BP6252_12380 [Coleophoma cylindrospora]|uniref:Uncharacterized protein n=1 Tax=Coleophoma cylindrospora TaxID=1849047 RepID=A0A3D8QGY0_9HELO|nr:hypothetical protein BP6252_12380 [Coleophoma cylindrospora]